MTIKRHAHFSEKFSISNWEKVGNLKVMTLLSVSSRGNSLCIIVPKDLVDINGIISGDRIRVWFLDHYRKKREDSSEPSRTDDKTGFTEERE
ncbi:MAG: hypothetical protein ABSB28_01535 [Candidatus Bathyarchaeia archaeon]